MFKHKNEKPKVISAEITDSLFPDEYAELEAEYIPQEPDGAEAPAPVTVHEKAKVSEPEPEPKVKAEPADEAEPEPEEAPEPEPEPEPEPVPEPQPEQAAPPAEEAPELPDASPTAPEPSDKKHKKKKKDNAKKKQSKDKKRKAHVTPFILLGILLLIVGVCAMNILYCANNFEVNFYHVESNHVTSDIRIVVVSDVHLKEYGEDSSELIDAVAALRPDIIISAGDMVTYGAKDYESMLTLCRGLTEIAPFYGVMGNHEDELVYLEDDTELRDRFADAGMILLINRCERIRIKNNDIEIVGVSGSPDGFDNYGGRNAMNKLQENHTALRICVAHIPTLFDQRLDEYDFDIGIAGHTHGGVVRLPVIGGLYSVEEGFLPDYDGGLYDLDNGAQLFVSRGLGSSGKIPRFNNTPELGVLDVKWY